MPRIAVSTVKAVSLRPDHMLPFAVTITRAGAACLNQRIGIDRALAASQILIATGTPANRLTYSGLGFSSPVAYNASAPGRAMNRRAEIIITPTN